MGIPNTNRAGTVRDKSNRRFVTLARSPSGPADTTSELIPSARLVPMIPRVSTSLSTISPRICPPLSTNAQSWRRSGGQLTTTRSMLRITCAIRSSACGSSTDGTIPAICALMRRASAASIGGPPSSISSRFSARGPTIRRTYGCRFTRAQIISSNDAPRPRTKPAREINRLERVRNSSTISPSTARDSAAMARCKPKFPVTRAGTE